MLAAGGSARMGRPKQLIVHEGAPLVARAAAAALDAGAEPVVVVVGAHAEEVRSSLAHITGVVTVVNDAWATGLASSLALGVREISTAAQLDGVVVMLADQPLVDAAAIRALLAEFRAGARIVAAGYDRTVGVPAIFASEHFPALMQLRGDSGAGAWLRGRLDEVTAVPLAVAGVDVDTTSDAARLAERDHPG